MIDFKELTIYLFASLVAVVVYLWKSLNERIKKIENKQSQQMTKENVEDAIKKAVLQLEVTLATIKSDVHYMKTSTQGVQLAVLEELKKLNKV